MVGIVQQLERALTDELDYRIEARNAATFRRTLAEFPRILIPRVIEAYTTERVLTTERIRGSKIDSISPLDAPRARFSPRRRRADARVPQADHDRRAFPRRPASRQRLRRPADSENPPTPSEVKAADRRDVQRPAVTPLARIENDAQRHAAPQPAEIDVKLALIDFGMTARLSTTLREHIIRLLLDLADNRGDDAAETLIEVGTELPGFDREGYVREIAGLMARNYDLPIGELDTGKVLYEAINISYQRGLRLPAELTLLAKTLFNLDTVTRSIDPTYSPIPTIREFGNQIVAERAKRDLNPRRLYQLATEGSRPADGAPAPARPDHRAAREQRFRDADQRSAVVADDSGAAEGREPSLLGPGPRGPAGRQRDAPAVPPRARHGRIRARRRDWRVDGAGDPVDRSRSRNADEAMSSPSEAQG